MPVKMAQNDERNDPLEISVISFAFKSTDKLVLSALFGVEHLKKKRART